MSNAGDPSQPGTPDRPGAYAEVPAPPGPFSDRAGGRAPYRLRSDHRSLRGLAAAVCILLAIAGALSLGKAAAHLNRASVADGRSASVFGLADADALDDADVIVGIVGAFDLLALLVTGIVFVVWQFRHGTNARALSHRVDGLGPGWAIGGWFIPFANLVLPGMQIYGASRESDPELPTPPRARRGEGSAIVVPWAVLFSTAFVIDRIGRLTFPDGGIAFRSDGLARLVTSDRISALASVVDVAAAIAGAAMVWRLTARQDARAAAVMAAAERPSRRRPASGWRARADAGAYGGPPPGSAYGGPSPASAPAESGPAGSAPSEPDAWPAPGAWPAPPGGSPPDDAR
jgi:hypothetical protein